MKSSHLAQSDWFKNLQMSVNWLPAVKTSKDVQPPKISFIIKINCI